MHRYPLVLLGLVVLQAAQLVVGAIAIAHRILEAIDVELFARLFSSLVAVRRCQRLRLILVPLMMRGDTSGQLSLHVVSIRN